ncbi:hypothetical protein Moror_11925 [Moniliophthora roreri MCA 2997]|uniref:Uncharacterized protein n=1 Tax=Moniliophthora roreri (strain MCA 2997) TaxID=1381753 RepID=V2Y601_MONRO|nr:hypothetical protein Moror_11925 [Moniliophthora roreri MCA 2997]
MNWLFKPSVEHEGLKTLGNRVCCNIPTITQTRVQGYTTTCPLVLAQQRPSDEEYQAGHVPFAVNHIYGDGGIDSNLRKEATKPNHCVDTTCTIERNTLHTPHALYIRLSELGGRVDSAVHIPNTTESLKKVATPRYIDLAAIWTDALWLAEESWLPSPSPRHPQCKSIFTLGILHPDQSRTARTHRWIPRANQDFIAFGAAHSQRRNSNADSLNGHGAPYEHYGPLRAALG